MNENMKWMSNGFAKLSIVSLMFFATNCTDPEGQIASSDVTDLQSETLIELNYDEMDELAINGIVQSDATPARFEQDGRLTCASVSRTEVSQGVIEVIIDFGEGCVGPYGRTRKGILKITHDGNYWANGAVVKIEPQNYFINDVQFEGTRTITNETTQASEGIVHAISLVNGIVTWPDETTATREIDVTRTWIRDNLNPSNDVLKFDGTASGTNRRGKAYTTEVLETLVYKVSCLNSGVNIPVQGVKSVVSRGQEMTLDFGDGACDNTYTITINGNTREITYN